MIGSHVLVEMLKTYGVDVIFGVPGDTSIPFMRRSTMHAGHPACHGP